MIRYLRDKGHTYYIKKGNAKNLIVENEKIWAQLSETYNEK